MIRTTSMETRFDKYMESHKSIETNRATIRFNGHQCHTTSHLLETAIHQYDNMVGYTDDGFGLLETSCVDIPGTFQLWETEDYGKTWKCVSDPIVILDASMKGYKPINYVLSSSVDNAITNAREQMIEICHSTKIPNKYPILIQWYDATDMNTCGMVWATPDFRVIEGDMIPYSNAEMLVFPWYANMAAVMYDKDPR